MSDDEYEVPLVDQRYFGAGIKRKRIHFVSAANEGGEANTKDASTGPSAAEKYLSIVLGQKAEAERTEAPVQDTNTPDEHEVATPLSHMNRTNTEDEDATCEICNAPIAADKAIKRHDLSIVHQICLKHSHPPSHLDRTSKSLAVLKSHGWDPDSRLGLGASGEGILYPIKARDNPQRVGLGAVLAEVQAKPKAVKLDAGKVRKMDQQSRREKDKLRDLFYRSEDIDRYLGDG